MSTPRVAVAYSGGRDSTALLHATLSAAKEQGVEVLALHVHHGLNPHADDWVAHCDAQCARWRKRGWPVRFLLDRLATRPAKGDSVEAWARQARYRALRAMALENDTSLILLAQHRRDQAETFLLQGLRGAGVAGLAAMPRVVERDGVTWMRPWLDVPRERIDAYVRRHRLVYVDDDSNADTRFARNRLRHRVWPAIVDAFPFAEGALADAASWAQEATACLKELADIDLAAAATPQGLDLHAWSTLSKPRGANVLREWLRLQTQHAPSAALLSRLQSELPARGSARWQLEGGQLRRYRGMLRYVCGGTAGRIEAAAAPARERLLRVRRPGVHPLPGWGGALTVSRVAVGGVPIAWLAHAELRARAGGERFQFGMGRPPRSLKKQYQALGVPDWEREGPLVYSGGQLVFVPGLGIDVRVMALPGQPQVALTWTPTEKAPQQAG